MADGNGNGHGVVILTENLGFGALENIVVKSL